MIHNKIKGVPMAVAIARHDAVRAENIEQIEIIHHPPAKV